MLPLLEKLSLCEVRSSSFPEGMSMSSGRNKSSVFGDSDDSSCSPMHPLSVCELVGGKGPPSTWILGRLGGDFKLGTEASSGGSVDLLSLLVELDRAKPESLLTTLSRCFLDLNSLEGESGAVFGLYTDGLTFSGAGEGGGKESGVGVTGGLVRPKESALKLPLDLCQSNGACKFVSPIIGHDSRVSPRQSQCQRYSPVGREVQVGKRAESVPS
jgi:hypothetical protein